jgi:hypothetical protein
MLVNPGRGAAQPSPFSSIPACRAVVDARQALDAARISKDPQQAGLARTMVADSTLCMKKLPAADSFDRDEALLLRAYATEALAALAVSDATVGDPSAMVAGIEADILVVCSDGYSARQLMAVAPLDLVFADLYIIANHRLPQNLLECDKELWRRDSDDLF